MYPIGVIVPYSDGGHIEMKQIESRSHRLSKTYILSMVSMPIRMKGLAEFIPEYSHNLGSTVSFEHLPATQEHSEHLRIVLQRIPNATQLSAFIEKTFARAITHKRQATA